MRIMPAFFTCWATLLLFSACQPTLPDISEYAYYSNGTGLIGNKGGEIYIADTNSPIRDAVCAIKAGALTSPTTFTLKQAPSNISIDGRPDARIIEVSPSNFTLSPKAVIGLSYRYLGDVDPISLQIFKLIPASGELIPLESPNADQTKKVLYGSTAELGYFVLLADAALTISTGSFTDSRDQQVYPWTQINGQKWMAANLNFNASSGSWCYEDDPANCQLFGRLYDQTTAASICPPGWHLPSHAEWKQLENALGMLDTSQDEVGWNYQGFVGVKLKSTSGWNQNGNGTNEAQLNILPAGYRDGDGSFYNKGATARLWTSTKTGAAVWNRQIEYSDDGIMWGQQQSPRGFSVRCIEGINQKIPSLTTSSPTAVTGFTAAISGEIVSVGASTITDQGFCWNTSGYPTISDNKVSLGRLSNTYSTNLVGLMRGTTYYISSYAVNADGVGYGDPQPFTTRSLEEESSTITDVRDNKTYKIVQMGEDWWLAENLNYSTSQGSWCYGDNSSNCSSFALLYDWETARSACPSGWVLPTDEDWKQLEMILGMTQEEADKDNRRASGNVGYRLKTSTGWAQNGNGSNDTEFGVLPAGFRDADGTYSYLGEEGRFWSNTEGPGGDPWVRYVQADFNGTYRTQRGPTRALSVRCIKEENQSLPTVVTLSPAEVAGFTATLGGEVIQSGVSSVYERGVCWNTTGFPSVTDSKRIMGSGTGTFEQQINGLELETTYFLRAYALNNEGIAYGSEKSFTTSSLASLSSFEIDMRDGKSYETILIGQTWWMTENLNYDARSASWCYNESNSNCSDYGQLYSWLTATGICMSGWRLPSDEQWKEMEIILGMDENEADQKGWRTEGNVGTRLKSTSLWAENGSGNNSSQLNIKPGGFRDVDGTFSFKSAEARLWTATLGTDGDPWIRFLQYNQAGVYRELRGPDRAMSVRCVKGTNPDLPTLNTGAAQNITGFTSQLSGEVLASGKSAISEKGFCWNTTGDPLISDNRIPLGSGSGSFSYDFTGLQLETTYYVRSYAINSEGIGYGDSQSFTTNSISSETGVFTDNRDTADYAMVRIGGLWWMAENLNWAGADSSWCYEGSAGNCTDYGRLYNWDAAHTACPAGWRLPTDGDWKSMEKALGMSEAGANDQDWRHDGDVGKRMKSTSGWYENGWGNNESRMNVKPAGFRDQDGTFGYINKEARFWTDTEFSSSEVWIRYLQYNDDGVYRKERGKDRGMSVRCVKN